MCLSVDNDRRRSSGLALLLTLIILVIMAAAAYSVSATVSMFRHRTRHIVDNTNLIYAGDSALRFAVQFASDLEPYLVSRPNEPDFSDLFSMSDEHIEQLIARFAEQYPDAAGSANDANDSSGPKGSVIAGPGRLIRGPYGPPWPLVSDPVELKIGPVDLTIEIEDENAKFPICWLLMTDQSLARSLNAGFQTLCEWMDYSTSQIQAIRQQVAQIAKIKPYRQVIAAIPPRPIPQPLPTAAHPRPDIRSLSRSDRDIMDLIALLHSQLLDHRLLARPVITGQDRRESLARYIGLWCAEQVNINTAPRHVLEATLAFVGNAANISEAIIQARRIQPFKDLADVRKRLTGYADALERCSRFITFNSNTFSIRVTACCGTARSVVTVGIIKSGKSVKVIGLERS